MVTASSKVQYYTQIYAIRDDYKRNLEPMFHNIQMVMNSKPRSVLDYGCGQGNLADLFVEKMGCVIAKYDPAIPEFSKLPEGHFDLGVNTDVLEHIPEEELDDLLENMRSYVDHAFFNIHLAEASEILANGENAHCTIKPAEWWRQKIAKHFGEAYLIPSVYQDSCSVITWQPPRLRLAVYEVQGWGREAVAKVYRKARGAGRWLRGMMNSPAHITATLAYQQRILREQLYTQDIQYRDIVDLVSGAKVLRHNNEIVLDTKFPIAYESLDHVQPFGTLQDNTRNYAFYQKCRDLYGEEMSFLDIGCSGGGIVFEFALNGHVAIGLEGSDLSQRRGRANWRTIPQNLFTCDVTKPFTLHAKKSKEAYGFDVISAWEVMEHIPEHGLTQMLANVKAHLKKGGIFVGSISKIPAELDPLHVTVQSNDWWVETFAKHGFEMRVGYDDMLEYTEFCRGIKGGMFDSHDYRDEPQKGLHFVARLKK